MSTKLRVKALPPIDRVLKAPFMEQVKIGVLTTQGLESEDLVDSSTSSLEDVLRAQLQTSDGIRGFFVSYLTRDSPPVPPPPLLYDAIAKVEDAKDLVDLSIVNVIMPAAQSAYFEKQARETVEEDAMEGSNVSMAKTSALTMQHGKEIIKVLVELSSASPKFDRVNTEIANVIEAAQSPSPPFPPQIQRWVDFFDKWGYDN
eukprot:CAMPEP_0118632010 /NCGR_PEP_ID=MMETSP0785-20121206/210_1 /TAXON_ID=91992 /ORGANISM="Bolidomonas pacifica, Strain CCMP 1866" /LENGTH=201 /DNA_ID=CAMNT_0006522739 /DNA_START=155 /DNA_END=757 /DNA_ORIENTATION=+